MCSRQSDAAHTHTQLDEEKAQRLESRMSMSAHGFGAHGTPQEFSIGFTVERSNPGLVELASLKADELSVVNTEDASVQSVRKRQRQEAPAFGDYGAVATINPLSAGMPCSVNGLAKERQPVRWTAAVPEVASDHWPRPQNVFGPKSSQHSLSSVTPAATATKSGGTLNAFSNGPSGVAATASAASVPPSPRLSSAEVLDVRRQLEERTCDLNECRSALRLQMDQVQLVARARDEVERERDQLREELEAERSRVDGMRAEVSYLRSAQEAERERQARGKEALRAALRERCFRSRAEARERLARESVRLGRLEIVSRGFAAGWEQRDGTAMLALKEREAEFETRKAQLEEDRKALRRRRGGTKGSTIGPGGEGVGNASGVDSNTGGAIDANGNADALELADLEESLNLRGSLLAKEKGEVLAEKKQLEREANEHLYELQLFKDLDELDPEMRECPSLPRDDRGVVESGSQPSQSALDCGKSAASASAASAANAAASRHRFVFLDLIARGGFAAVFKAYDLQTHSYTACKLHRIAKEWGDRRKEAFVRHVEREIDITVDMRHRRIVQTYAVFEIDATTFVSVMPFCNGGSLAELLRKFGQLNEKDAKAIMHQILNGLLYLHTREQPIIHYDLKPANILFHDGEVKLSDFGLSKVMAPHLVAAAGSGSLPHGMELTSYGSGTHGYLPPECYDGENTSRVCPKVDVFSAGVVHFVMLFHPHKPFFRQASQQQIVQMNVREEINQLEFPSKVSAQLQFFLRRALASKREERSSVHELLADQYMQPQKLRAAA